MSRTLLHNWECSIEKNKNNTEELLRIAEDIYNTAYARGKASEEQPQGVCENCDFRKFTEKFIDGVVEVMNENGITSIEQLSEILKGGAE